LAGVSKNDTVGIDNRQEWTAPGPRPYDFRRDAIATGRGVIRTLRSILLRIAVADHEKRRFLGQTCRIVDALVRML